MYGKFMFFFRYSVEDVEDEAVEHGRPTTEDGDVPRQPSVLESFTLH